MRRDGALLALSFVSAALTAYLYYAFGGVAAFCASVVCLAWLISGLWKWLRKKPRGLAARKFILGALARGFGALVRFMQKLARGSRKPRGDGARRLTSYSDERSEIEVSRKTKQERKKVKWKDITSERERVRYIYRAFVRLRIKNGFSFAISETPNEIMERLDEAGTAGLFALYNVARYADDERRVTPGDVASIAGFAGGRAKA